MESYYSREETMRRQFVMELDAEGWEEAYPYTAGQLLKGQEAPVIMQEQARRLGTDNAEVVGTLFAKRYSVFAMGAAVCFTLYDDVLDLSHHRIGFRFSDSGALQYAAKTAEAVVGRDLEASVRRRVFIAYWHQLDQHLRVLFQAVSACTGANEKVMLSLVSHNLQQLYASLAARKDSLPPEQAKRVLRDATFLHEHQHGLTALRFRSYAHARSKARPLLIRKHCCLAYRLVSEGESCAPADAHDARYCLTCPKLDSEQRRKRLDDEL
ncbi:hypothetical protein IDH44_08915 [Paenibacillus sp. IB182496]|uniref:Aerobactin siderophore biosynthesis IucA/IucC-like C-terminal domain-containing protein n=1 Tax=Paenibacillus sabuli TaxID=2772509 RepID=A0A927GR72_9BACL|nr:hypothetical protein [Paenibacillus sabuli]MBD2845309.1 hypothetical protein [Paenibacillus sabuli]